MPSLIRHRDLKTKKLFFPASVESQVEELEALLQGKHYREICQRMKKKGFHSGFACLFYGSPGTGKTETVYQLAKLTGRDVMVVDIPQVRSMWVGESEKNVKGIFTRYAGLVKDSKRTPILLFNEADAIIGKPDAQSWAKIWRTMIPELDKDVTNSLAQQYDFSGGQIENIARHYTIEIILKGEETVTIQTLRNFCEQESIKKKNKAIGFV